MEMMDTWRSWPEGLPATVARLRQRLIARTLSSLTTRVPTHAQAARIFALIGVGEWWVKWAQLEPICCSRWDCLSLSSRSSTSCGWTRDPLRILWAELALNAESSDAQQRAAIQLADYGDGAQEHLRRVFGESTSDTVRMICIDGFGATWDYDSMGTLLDSIEDPSSEVRGRAAQVIAKLTGRDRRFRANGLEEERALLLRHMREDWEEIRNSPHMDELVRRLKESHEKRKK